MKLFVFGLIDVVTNDKLYLYFKKIQYISDQTILSYIMIFKLKVYQYYWKYFQCYDKATFQNMVLFHVKR